MMSFNAYAQIVYAPLNSTIYDFLDRLASGHIITVNDEVKPYSRKEIAEYLKLAEIEKDKLNPVEAEELNWYEEEYAHELLSVNERWFLYKYSDSLFSIRVSPIGGYGISSTGGSKGHNRWWGISSYGYISNWLGASFSYKDIGQFGANVDIKKDFTPERGYYINSYPPGGIEFSDVKGAINFNWNWGGVSLIKDDVNWGHGKFGQLILSDKPESYPQIQLFLSPAKWIRFYYMHGWLNSLVLDSSQFYYNHLESAPPVIHQEYIGKYVAANLISLTPVENLDLSLGNSVIYSGSLRPEFFIPFLYYKVMDHNTGRGNVDDSNGQIFFDISSRNIQNFQVYSTVFIDAATISGLLNGSLNQWWKGYTIGAKNTDFLIPNLNVTIEYTKIMPSVYEHKYDTETYKHIGYVLGDWLGQNADQIRIQADYKPNRPLTLHGYYERLRKGGLADIAIVYYGNTPPQFLSGHLRKDFDLGLEVDYEYLHELTISASYKYSSISDEDKTRTPSYLLGDKINFSLTIGWGL